MTAMLQLGKLTIDAPFYQAGLAGYSDAAMRLIARRHGAPYCITEAMLDHFLINGGKGLKAAELDDEDHPIAGQLMGSHPADIAAAAKVLVTLGYDVVDVNLACPVKKVRKKARGGHLLSVPDEAIAILDAVMQAVGSEVPVTCKLRRAFDDSPEAAGNFDRVFEAAIELGLAGATVHSRTVEQKYHGPGWRPFLRDLAERYALGRFRGSEGPRGRVQPKVVPEGEAANPSTLGPLDPSAPPPSHPAFTLGGSGDVWTALDIFDMLEDTGVDWVSVARGCIGNPWVFTQARRLMAARSEQRGAASEQDPRRARFSGWADPPSTPTLDPPPSEMQPPTIHQQRDVLLDHLELSVRLHGEHQASRMMRKFGIRFARHHPAHDAVKADFIKCGDLADWRRVIDDRYADDGPGVDIHDALPEEARTQHSDETCEPNSPAAHV